MTIPARDSIYVRDRTHFLRGLETQIAKLRASPGNRRCVVQGLRELARLTPGCIEASRVPAIATLMADVDQFDVYRVADGLEGAVPLEVRDPFSGPATWQ
ncbi:hypothetical protein PENNAL_c0036G06124 [Penicillium nalgiovense]|uniref:Uncharacterized protein n=1 Tax=Penicillium nalgiovense TaxID=60175 RepID=A0A1V6Y5D6_PENNA|nr:hypothetical protein PENNAL_c0036G06124 [Penicillium nalgiovense]